MPKNLKQYAEAPVRLSAGHRLCPGCGEPTAARQVLMATEKPVIVANATGCFEVSTTIMPTLPGMCPGCMWPLRM